MEENKKFNGYPDFPNFIPDNPIPPAPCMPPIPPAPCMPPVPSVVEGSDLYEAMNNLSKRVNVCISTYNDVMANCYETLKNLERAGEANGAYYNGCEVWTEQGYYADENAGYTITHKANLDRHGQPIRIKLHLPYNNITNSGVYQSIFDASMITYADKIFTAQPNTIGENNVSSQYYGVCLQNGTPINGVENAALYTYGFTKMGTLRVYQNSVTVNQLLCDTVMDSMGCSGVLIQNGEICADSYFQNIPSYDVQTSRIAIGQNTQTKEVIILCCGNTNSVNMAGLTSKAVANIMLGLGCTIAVEIAEGANISMLDKGQMMFEPENDAVSQNNCFFYISRRKFYKNDFTEELGKLTQNYGQILWENFLQGKQIEQVRDDLSAQIENVEEELQDHIAEADATFVKKSGDTMTGPLNMSGNNVNNVSAVTSVNNQQLNLFSDARVNLNTSETGTVSNMGKQLNDVATPQADTDAANKQYVDSGLDEKVSKAGDTMTGALNMSGNDLNNVSAVSSSPTVGLNLYSDEGVYLNNGSGIISANSKRLQSVATPTSNTDGANKQYVDNSILNLKNEVDNTYLKLSGGTMVGEINMNNSAIRNVENPAQDGDVANKLYVDTVENSINDTISELTDRVGDIENNVSGLSNSVSSLNKTVSNLQNSINQTNELVTNILNGTADIAYVKKSGDTMTGSLNMSDNEIKNVKTPTDATDATNKEYVDNSKASAVAESKEYTDAEIENVDPSGKYLPLTGGSLSGPLNIGDINMDESGIVNLPKIVGSTDGLSISSNNVNISASGGDENNVNVSANGGAFTAFGDTAVLTANNSDVVVSANNGSIILSSGTNVELNNGVGGISANSKTINNVANPVVNTDAANKQYVDDLTENVLSEAKEYTDSHSGDGSTSSVVTAGSGISQPNVVMCIQPIISGNNSGAIFTANIKANEGVSIGGSGEKYFTASMTVQITAGTPPADATFNNIPCTGYYETLESMNSYAGYASVKFVDNKITINCKFAGNSPSNGLTQLFLNGFARRAST